MVSRAESEYEALDEALWAELRTLLDWHERFTLVLLYADDPRAVAAVRRRLTDVLRLRSQVLLCVEPSQPMSMPGDVFAALRPAVQRAVLPVWIDLYHRAGDAAWDQARDALLARMNEQRAGIERDHPALMIMTLPTPYAARLPVLAPDLWSVRTLSRVLEPRRVTQRAAPRDIVEHSPVSLSPASAQEQRLYAEWRRLAAAQGLTPFSPLASDLVALALARGDSARALEVADEAVRCGRAYVTDQPLDSAASRALSIALDDFGNVNRELGRAEAAAENYRESLALRRRLLEVVGETPQALADVGMSLAKMAELAFQRADMAGALIHMRDARDAFTRANALAPQVVGIERNLTGARARLAEWGGAEEAS